MRIVQLEGVDNVRDLGGIPVAGGRMVRPGRFFRGGALARATRNDQKMLFGELGIACVIDLRCGWELEAKPDAVPSDVEYLHIPFYDLEKVGIEYTERVEGTKALGHDIACKPDHFYRSLANRLTTTQMRKALDTIFSHALRGEPVYQHCSGGKDRAGIMSLLILSVLGVDRGEILEDYLLTNVSRDARYDEMFERFLRLSDGDEQKAHELVISHRAVTSNVEAFYEAIDAEYGSWNAFMRDQLAMSDERMDAIRKQCTCVPRDLRIGLAARELDDRAVCLA